TLLLPERQSVRLATADDLLRVEAWVGRCQRPVARAALRGWGGVRERLPLPQSQRYSGADCSAPANCPVAGRRLRVCPRPLVRRRWTHELLSVRGGAGGLA